MLIPENMVVVLINHSRTPEGLRVQNDAIFHRLMFAGTGLVWYSTEGN